MAKVMILLFLLLKRKKNIFPSLYCVSPPQPPPPPKSAMNKYPLCEEYGAKSSSNHFSLTSIFFSVVEHVSKLGVIAISQLAMM